jgi:undecaprenyl-diphosphatase
MLTELLQWDLQVFFWINQAGQHPWLDVILPILRNKYIWAPLYLFIATFLVINYKWKGVLGIIFLLITVGIGDQLSSQLIKPTVERLRPCQHPELQEQVRLIVDCGGPWSFPSSHATNHFAVAVFLIGYFWRQYRWVLPAGLVWAGSISYAQVYVGVHFPVDILTGAVLGTLIGLFTTWGYRQCSSRLSKMWFSTHSDKNS